MNNIKFLSIFIVNIIVITTATPNDNKNNLRRLLQQQERPKANLDGWIYVPQFGETIINVTGNDYDPDGGSVKINEIVKEPWYGQVAIIDDHNIQYIICTSDCDVFDTFQYNVIDYDDDNLVSETATVFIEITCGSPSSEPTPTPLGNCDHPLNKCSFQCDGFMYYYKCIGESLFEYRCPPTVSCDDGNGFDEDEFDKPCTQLYLFDDSEDCC